MSWLAAWRATTLLPSDSRRTRQRQTRWRRRRESRCVAPRSVLSALGSYEPARTFLEQALDVATDPADRADLHERAFLASLELLDREPVLRHAAATETERRKTGDREAIAKAGAIHVVAINYTAADPAAALEMGKRLWDEFSDLEQTQAGVDIMSALARAYNASADSVNTLAWLDRLLPIAERLGDLGSIARGIQRRGVALANTGRPREGLILLRGVHQLALTTELGMSNDVRDVELGCRVLLTFYEQWGDPAAGLALGREGLEIGRRRGSHAYTFQMVGNSTICAMRVGEWDWAAEILEETIAVEHPENDLGWTEFHVDRALLAALRGEDPSDDLEIASRSRAGMTDPQYESYESWARAAGALAGGDLAAAVAHAEHAAAITNYFTPLALPLGARAALWAGDAGTARRLLDAVTATSHWGPVLDADKGRIEAGLAALEGRPADALSGFLDARRAYAQLNLRFEEAACAVDLAVLLPGAVRESAAAATAVEEARATLTRLAAAPYLARLEQAVPPDRPPVKAGRPAAAPDAASGVPAR